MSYAPERRIPFGLTCTILACVVVVLTAITWGLSHPSDGATSQVTRLHACVNDRTGVQRGPARAYEFHCRRNEQEVSWGVR